MVIALYVLVALLILLIMVAQYSYAKKLFDEKKEAKIALDEVLKYSERLIKDERKRFFDKLRVKYGNLDYSSIPVSDLEEIEKAVMADFNYHSTLMMAGSDITMEEKVTRLRNLDYTSQMSIDVASRVAAVLRMYDSLIDYFFHERYEWIYNE